MYISIKFIMKQKDLLKLFIYKIINETIGDPFDIATSKWFYTGIVKGSYIDDGNIKEIPIPDKVSDILEQNAVKVYNHVIKTKQFLTDCGVVSSIWQNVFKSAGIDARIIDGNYYSGVAPFPASSDHVWLEINIGDNQVIIFDPTARQFGQIDIRNYWIDEERRVYLNQI